MLLELKGVSASYGSVPAIGGVSIAVDEGEAVGLLGANGAGKSTTLRAIMAVARHIVVLDHGQKIAEGSPREIVENPEVIRAYLGSGYAHVPAPEAS